MGRSQHSALLRRPTGVLRARPSQSSQGTDIEITSALVSCIPPKRETESLTSSSSRIKIRQFVRNLYVDTDLGMQWATLFNLDAKTRSLYETLSPALRDFNGRPCLETDFRESLGLQTLYHMSRFIPHLAMIRLLQRQASPADEYVQLCAQITVRHINRVSDIIMNSVTSNQTTLPILPPFVAYCSFTAVSVYMAYLYHSGKDWNDINDPTVYLCRVRLLSNLHLLNQLRRVWSPVRVLVCVLAFLLRGIYVASTDVVVEYSGRQYKSIWLR